MTEFSSLDFRPRARRGAFFAATVPPLSDLAGGSESRNVAEFPCVFRLDRIKAPSQKDHNFVKSRGLHFDTILPLGSGDAFRTVVEQGTLFAKGSCRSEFMKRWLYVTMAALHGRLLLGYRVGSRRLGAGLVAEERRLSFWTERLNNGGL